MAQATGNQARKNSTKTEHETRDEKEKERNKATLKVWNPAAADELILIYMEEYYVFI